MEFGEITLLHIPWQDIIFDRIFIYLKLKDIIKLRSLSTEYKALITEYLRNITKLYLHNSQITNSSLYSLTDVCENLEVLSLHDCKNIDDKNITQLIKKNTSLKCLDVSNCSQLTAKFLQSIKCCTNLKKLTLNRSQWLNSKDLQLIVKYFGKLEHLDISECHKLDKESINSLIFKCTNIKELNLSFIESIDDYTLFMLADNSKLLESLSLNNCWKITEQGLSKILEYCPLLNSLELNHCPQISHQFHDKISKDGIKTNNYVRYLKPFPLNIQI